MVTNHPADKRRKRCRRGSRALISWLPATGELKRGDDPELRPVEQIEPADVDLLADRVNRVAVLLIRLADLRDDALAYHFAVILQLDDDAQAAPARREAEPHTQA